MTQAMREGHAGGQMDASPLLVPLPVAPRLSRTRKVLYSGIILLSVVLIYFLTIRELRNFVVPSTSMLPTLEPTDYIYTLNASGYGVGDIVVLKDPTIEGGYLVKRIVATGGDTISIRWGALYRNGEYVSEPYTREPMIYDFPPSDVAPSFSVPPGEIFVLGDNRNQSDDSSNWGPDKRLNYSVPVSSIVGTVQGIYLPFNRARQLQRFPALTVALP